MPALAEHPSHETAGSNRPVLPLGSSSLVPTASRQAAHVIVDVLLAVGGEADEEKEENDECADDRDKLRPHRVPVPPGLGLQTFRAS